MSGNAPNTQMSKQQTNSTHIGQNEGTNPAGCSMGIIMSWQTMLRFLLKAWRTKTTYLQTMSWTAGSDNKVTPNPHSHGHPLPHKLSLAVFTLLLDPEKSSLFRATHCFTSKWQLSHSWLKRTAIWNMKHNKTTEQPHKLRVNWGQKSSLI